MASTAVTAPNFGLYYDRPPIALPGRALKEGYNFRVKNGTLGNLNLGWEKFSENWVLDGQAMKIDNFFPREQGEHLLFIDTEHVYRYDAAMDVVVYLTPQYDTGTAAAAGTTVTGIGTAWVANVKPGDKIHFGAANFADPAGVWFEVLSVTDNDTLELTATAGVVANGPYTILQTFIGTTSNLWVTDTFVQDETSGDDLWFATNGIDDVITWNGTDATVTRHPELGFVCQTLGVFSNMMIYGNVNSGTDFPTSIINSDVGLPLNAGSTGTGLSEQFRVHDDPGEILALRPLGNNLAIYSRRVLIVAQFIGDPLIFAFRIAASGVGPLAGGAVADFGDYHEIAAPDGQYRFDGVAVHEINRHVWREIIKSGDPVRRGQIYTHFDEENGDLFWSVPATTDAFAGTAGAAPATAWVEHYLEDVPVNVSTPYSKRAIPFTAMGYFQRQVGLTWAEAEGAWEEYNFAWNDQFFSLAFPLNLAGDSTGQIYILNQSQSADGVLLPSFVWFGRSALGTGRERFLLKRVYPFTQKLNGYLDVTVYMSDFASGPSINVGTYELDTTQPEGQFFVSPFRRGRFTEIKFGTDGEPWVLEGYDTDVVRGGSR